LERLRRRGLISKYTTFFLNESSRRYLFEDYLGFEFETALLYERLPH
jgi:hypothetical protein